MPKRNSRRLRPASLSAIAPHGPAENRNPPRRRTPIVPCVHLFQFEMPDATPAMTAVYARGEAQLLLAKVRYNRLVDMALGLLTYSLESQVRATVPNVGPVEIDELYLGLGQTGRRFIVVVHVQSETNQLGIVQIEQDLAFCSHAFPDLSPRLVAVQFKKDDDGEVIVMFELYQRGDEIKQRAERHYRLVPADQISKQDLEKMANG